MFMGCVFCLCVSFGVFVTKVFFCFFFSTVWPDLFLVLWNNHWLLKPVLDPHVRRVLVSHGRAECVITQE